jgi:hypothetical protein
VRLLPSGRAWFLVTRTSSTAAFVARPGYSSPPLQLARGAWSRLSEIETRHLDDRLR